MSIGETSTSRVRPRCWGIGLGRTGTTSFCRALRVLGYKDVKHNPKFDALRDLEGGADNGVTKHYKYLDYIFPGSKFVLMTRKLPDWLRSMEHAAQIYPVKKGNYHVSVDRRMTLFDTVEFNAEKFTYAYARHHTDVRHYFADRPNDLLEMSLTDGDGWDKLCPFLGLPSPKQPFPHSHKREVELARHNAK